MKLKNIKASFLVNQNFIEKKSGCKKCIFKEGDVTYIIYTHTPYLLITLEWLETFVLTWLTLPFPPVEEWLAIQCNLHLVLIPF